MKIYALKRILLLIAIIVIGSYAFAQSPDQVSCQSVIRNASGILIAEHPLCIRISILHKTDAGTSVYSENFLAISNITHHSLMF